MKTPRQKLKDKIDKIHSKLIRKLETKCVTCNSEENLQCGHLFTRTAMSTRWDIEEDGNSHAQCSGCNLRHEYDSYPYNNWYITKFGKDKWDELYARHKSTKKYSIVEMEELYKTLKQKLEG